MAKRKGKNLDKQFTEILDQALEEARKIECSPAEYREQLETWMSTLEIEIDAIEVEEE